MKIINNQNIVLINEVNSLIKYESKVYLSCNHFTAFALFELVESLKKATQVQIMLSIDLNSEDDFRLIHAPSEKQLELALDRKSKINEIKKFIDQIDNLKLHQLVKTLFEENIEKFEKRVCGAECHQLPDRRHAQ